MRFRTDALEAQANEQILVFFIHAFLLLSFEETVFSDSSSVGHLLSAPSSSSVRERLGV